MERRPRRALRPSVESVESRELLSGLQAAMLARRSLPMSRLLLSSPAPTQGTPAPPVIPGQGTPSLHELARQQFRAGFNGHVTVGPGRYSDQARIVAIGGKGGSNQFLHGSLQMAFVFPTNPSAPITGTAYLQDKNQTSGGQVAFDLVADPNALDAHGRPTLATFAADPNIYAGIYYFDQAAGTVHIRYRGDTAQVIFNGRIYTNGLSGTLRGIGLA